MKKQSVLAAACLLSASLSLSAVAAATDFKAKGDFKTILDDPTACATAEQLKSFTAMVTPKDGGTPVKANLTAVCPAVVTVSLSGVPAGKVPTGGVLQRPPKTPVNLTFDNGQSPDRTLTFSGDFKSFLDNPPACSSSGFTAFLSLPNKPLTAATVVEVCMDTVVLSTTALSSGQNASSGLLLKSGKTPIALTSGGSGSGQGSASSGSEKIFAAEGDFKDLLDDPAKCVNGNKLPEFTAYLTVASKPIVKGNVKAVCPSAVFISSTDVPDGQIPASGLLSRLLKPNPVELRDFHDTTYKEQLVSVTAGELRDLCDDFNCKSPTLPASVRINVVLTDGSNVSVPPPVLISLQPDLAVVRFLAPAAVKVALVVFQDAKTQGVVAVPTQGAPSERMLVAHKDLAVLPGLTGNACLSDPNVKKYSGFAYAQGKFVAATVRAVCPGEVYFSTNGLAADDKVTGGLLVTESNGTIPIEFDPVPFQVYVISVRGHGHDMKTICDTSCSDAQLKQLRVEIVPGPQSRITGGERPKVVAVNGDLAVLQFVAPENFEIASVTISGGNQTIFARPLPGPLPTHGQPNVTFSIVAPDNIMWNFGKRIADRYTVVDLTIKNPGTKKIQVKRSAIWFEVDYASIAPGKSLYSTFTSWPATDVSKIASQDPSGGTELTTSQQVNKKGLRHYRYGIDHVEQQTAEDWLTLLGVYDGFANFAALSGPKAIDLVMAIVTGLSGTAIHSRGLKNVLPAFTGVIVPAVKNYVWSDEEEKRKRTNLLAQTLADLVQIPSQSAITTKVFLPKFPIDKLFSRNVIIESVRDVHIDLEVISDTLPEAVAKGKITAGMTKDQVVQALGIPDSKTDGAGLSSTWVYNTGNYKQVVFDNSGKVVSWTARTVDEQVDALVSKGTTADVRALLGLGGTDPKNAEALWDGGVIWPKPAGLDRTLRFDKSNKLVDANYTVASDKNNGFVSLKALAAADVQTKLAGYFPDGKDSRPAAPLQGSTDTKEIYNSPDVRAQTVTVTFDSTGKATDITVAPTKF
jgi:hypothetical protein